MSKTFDVHIDLHGQIYPVGKLWIHSERGSESASFEYAPTWIAQKNSFAIDPALPLTKGQFHTKPAQKLFSCMTDCSPDRWGRTLMDRDQTRRAREQNETPRTLLESDYLLRVNDAARQGALRFTEHGKTTFLASPGTGIPDMVFLEKMLQASIRTASKTESDEDLRILFEPGGSLGGARPKASVLDAKNTLYIAKFPKDQDEWDIPLWEWIAFQLASKAGIKTPATKIERIGQRNVLLLERFDRDGGKRVPFVSAMTMLGASDGEHRSYLEIAEILRAEGASPKEDLTRLWQHMVFNILISNRDDHLRNHGFLRHDKGWVLSPVYDLEAAPAGYQAATHHTYINLYDGSPVMELAFEVAEEFGLNTVQATTLAKKTGDAVSKWENIARQVGATKRDIELMRSAFEHDELKKLMKRAF